MKTLKNLPALGALLTLVGCASTAPPDRTTTPAAEAAVAGQQACPLFAARMCDALDPRSEACGSIRRVTQWLSEATCQAALTDVDQTLANVGTLRQDCREVGQRLCEKAGEAKVCEMLNSDLNMVPPEDCSKLLEAYPQVEEAFLAKLKSEAPLSAEQQSSLVAGDPASFGPQDAKVTMVVFSDFQCPYCAMAAKAMGKIRDNYSDRVRMVFRHFPLPFHQQARPAALAARAAQAQGMFWQYHDLLFAHQDELEEAQLLAYAKEAGLKQAPFKKALKDEATAAAVDQDVALAETVAVSGTPTMFVNGVRVENPTDYDSVAEVLNAALAEPPAAAASAPDASALAPVEPAAPPAAAAPASPGPATAPTPAAPVEPAAPPAGP